MSKRTNEHYADLRVGCTTGSDLVKRTASGRARSGYRVDRRTQPWAPSTGALQCTQRLGEMPWPVSPKIATNIVVICGAPTTTLCCALHGPGSQAMCGEPVCARHGKTFASGARHCARHADRPLGMMAS